MVRNILEFDYTPYKCLILNNDFDNSVFHGHNQLCQQNYIHIIFARLLASVNMIGW